LVRANQGGGAEGARDRRRDFGAALLHDPNWDRDLAREAHDHCKRGLDPNTPINCRIGPGVTPIAVSREISTTWTFGQAADGQAYLSTTYDAVQAESLDVEKADSAGFETS